jgi:hypothetical protein
MCGRRDGGFDPIPGCVGEGGDMDVRTPTTAGGRRRTTRALRGSPHPGRR